MKGIAIDMNKIDVARVLQKKNREIIRLRLSKEKNLVFRGCNGVMVRRFRDWIITVYMYTRARSTSREHISCYAGHTHECITFYKRHTPKMISAKDLLFKITRNYRAFYCNSFFFRPQNMKSKVHK